MEHLKDKHESKFNERKITLFETNITVFFPSTCMGDNCAEVSHMLKILIGSLRLA